MRWNDVLARLKSHREDVGNVIRIIREISQLDRDRAANLDKLKSRLSLIEKRVEVLVQRGFSLGDLRSLISDYRKELQVVSELRRKEFGAQLDNGLKKLGISLSGQYPELRAGLFTISIDFDANRATLWYGPKQERLGVYPMSVDAIVKGVEERRRLLGSGLSEKEFLEKLYQAYHRVVGLREVGPAPIINVLAELAFAIQDSKFLDDPRRENYKSYGRADFSYDLYRMRQFRPDGLFSERIRLTVATRAQTKTRSGFLWVPDDETGKGAYYSHLQVEEGGRK